MSDGICLGSKKAITTVLRETSELFDVVMGTAELGAALEVLTQSHQQWSEKTFGTIEQRGPIGALNHIQKEAKEAIEEYELSGSNSIVKNHKYRVELADILLCLNDAIWRSGFTFQEIIEAAQEKLYINMEREWPPIGSVPPDESVHHIKLQS
jgi:hypothetical protein